MFTLNCRGRLLTIDTPVVMGILNLTPDSFHAPSRKHSGELVDAAASMIEAGAAIIDVGGQSTRPGSVSITADEEASRVLAAIAALSSAFPDLVISVDTFYASVARSAVKAGASIVNDVGGGTLDENMFETVAELQVPYVLMHMRGTPQNMHLKTQYHDVVLDVFDSINQQLHRLRQLGVKDIIVDPGFGFAKTMQDGFRLLQSLSFFRQLDCPVLAGLSRKGMIHRSLNISPDTALNGTTVLNTIALMNGANILRVHDVREACEAIKLVQLTKEKEQQ